MLPFRDLDWYLVSALKKGGGQSLTKLIHLGAVGMEPNGGPVVLRIMAP